jgi:hypothetical protein
MNDNRTAKHFIIFNKNKPKQQKKKKISEKNIFEKLTKRAQMQHQN